MIFILQILAAECADKLSEQLATHVEDRTFPNTEEILMAARGIVEISQQVYHDETTSYQCRWDVITSHRRWYDIVLMFCVYWPGGTQPVNNVISTSTRHHVASLIRRCFDVMCLLGGKPLYLFCVPLFKRVYAVIQWVLVSRCLI